ncbi:hypothetical protein BDV96DRAFT_654039 [Lophiotrema nucula]|uniref:RING-type domain-containing protein n=1 Tax=Lophiotrema nucula TaxID=690887 RepID=A0A6A5YLU7_9PLEO|nr:hypothetical protein BDV96DRAFT_654039 [Lophiotrema nucula]
MANIPVTISDFVAALDQVELSTIDSDTGDVRTAGITSESWTKMCNHLLGKSCLEEWLYRSRWANCPICRQDLNMAETVHKRSRVVYKERYGNLTRRQIFKRDWVELQCLNEIVIFPNWHRRRFFEIWRKELDHSMPTARGQLLKIFRDIAKQHFQTVAELIQLENQLCGSSTSLKSSLQNLPDWYTNGFDCLFDKSYALSPPLFKDLKDLQYYTDLVYTLVAQLETTKNAQTARKGEEADQAIIQPLKQAIMGARRKLITQVRLKCTKLIVFMDPENPTYGEKEHFDFAPAEGPAIMLYPSPDPFPNLPTDEMIHMHWLTTYY